ncbi:alanyl-tRNA editing protein [Candidatus Woesearchaeota archaeon]|nr:alanyl-tRNA editing protein [Candidatus Woesearchaeota archaeon]
MEKLFWKDPYMKECEAKVTSKMGPEIQLDQTVFFAFSGGQASDQGTIGGVKVQEAVKTDDNITYVLEKVPDFNEGDTVKVEIDWNHRHKLMRLHSAAHIVSFLVFEKWGMDFKDIIGSNISIDKARLDFATEKNPNEIIPEIEETTNRLTSEDHEIKAYEDPEQPGRRLWEMHFDDKDILFPCGGTHVKNSQEIGQIKLKRKNIGAGKERIEVSLV